MNVIQPRPLLEQTTCTVLLHAKLIQETIP
jgi:hypothetical protein